jgi:hypothetical protein
VALDRREREDLSAVAGRPISQRNAHRSWTRILTEAGWSIGAFITCVTFT